MGAKKNPKEDEAYQLYKNGMKLIDIAKKLDVPDGTVRRWKSTHSWDGERSVKKNERSKKKRTIVDLMDDGTKETLQNEDLSPHQQMFCIYYIKSFNATQSYQKSFGGTYTNAMVEGCKLLRNPKVKAEIDRLKEIKRQQIICSEEDIVELHMRIAFSDIGDYVEFHQEEQPVMTMFGPLKVKNEDGIEEQVTKIVNVARFKDSAQLDTQLIQQVKQGKDGASIKLIDKQRSLDWLDRHFLNNPMDIHKMEYDKRRLELDYLRLEAETKSDSADTVAPDDNFVEMLNAVAKDVWNDEQLE